jgi:hypothetical protein
VTWSSGNNSIVAVDTTGIVTAKKRGTTLVSAAIGGQVGSATIVVGPRFPGM